MMQQYEIREHRLNILFSYGNIFHGNTMKSYRKKSEHKQEKYEKTRIHLNQSQYEKLIKGRGRREKKFYFTYTRKKKY